MIKLGQVVKKFKSKKGNEVLIRVIRISDAKDLMDIMNSIIAEDDFIIINKKLTLKEEKEWMRETIKKIKKNQEIFLCALVGSKIIGSSSIKRGIGRKLHVGDFGIIIGENFRKEGIGEQLMSEILKIAKIQMKLKIVTLLVFATNKRAQSLYKKMGFKIYGELPKAIDRHGEYISSIQMYKELK